MKKSTRIVKRLLALFLVVLMSIESFGAVVSDNDGSAFITKAEFDSLKNDFQSQIDQYNTSIDSKIDGAIASYLSGIQVGRKVQLELDRNCNYEMPIKCFYGSTADLWNLESSDYYCLSVPAVDNQNYLIYVQRFRSDRNMQNDVSYSGDNSGGPHSIRTNHLTTDDGYLGIRAQWGADAETLDGQNGELYRIDKSTSQTREIDGTYHTVWNLRDIIFGQDKLFYVAGNFNAAWDGTNDEWRPWVDYKFIGYYNNSPWTTLPPNQSQWNTTIAECEDAWTNAMLKMSYAHMNVVASKIKPESGIIMNDFYTLTSLSDIWDSHYIDTVTWPVWQNQTYLNSPLVRVLSSQTTNKNHMIFGGNANLPSYNDTSFSYAPRLRESTIANTHMTYGHVYWEARQKTVYYNFGPNPFSTGPYNHLIVIVWPQWHATKISDFRNDTTFDFSMIRASLVEYKDQNGKSHYLDEGMFLGTYDSAGDVEFVLQFDSTETSEVSLGVSKKPWDFNHQSSDNPKWNYTTTSTSVDIVAGSGLITVPTNKEIKVKVPDIQKGEELYLIWNPPGTEYVELTKFSDYYINTED